MVEDVLTAHSCGRAPAVHQRLYSERQYADSTLPEANVQHIRRYVFVKLSQMSEHPNFYLLIGTILSTGIKACSLVTELLQHVPKSCVSALECPGMWYGLFLRDCHNMRYQHPWSVKAT